MVPAYITLKSALMNATPILTLVATRAMTKLTGATTSILA